MVMKKIFSILILLIFLVSLLLLEELNKVITVKKTILHTFDKWRIKHTFCFFFSFYIHKTIFTKTGRDEVALQELTSNNLEESSTQIYLSIYRIARGRKFVDGINTKHQRKRMKIKANRSVVLFFEGRRSWCMLILESGVRWWSLSDCSNLRYLV